MFLKQSSPYKHLQEMIDKENLHMVLSKDKRIELMKKLNTVELINTIETLLVKYEGLLKSKNIFEEYKFEVNELLGNNIDECKSIEEVRNFYKNLLDGFSELNKKFSFEEGNFEENLMAELSGIDDKKIILDLPGPINDFFYKHSILLSYGTIGGDRYSKVLEESARGFASILSKKIRTKITLKKDVSITEEDIKENHIIVFGGPGLNDFADEFSDELPVTVDVDTIKVGEIEFNGDDDRIIMVCPNPLNIKRYILLYSSTGIEGLKDIYGIHHGPTDFVVGNSFNWLAKGYFDKSDKNMWQYSHKDVELNKELMDMLNKDGWNCIDSKHYIFHYQRGSSGEKDIKEIINIHENNYSELLKYSKISADEVVDIYLFHNNLQKEEIVGSKSDVTFDHFTPRIYMVYNEAVKQYGVEKLLRPVYRHINWQKG